MRSFRSFIKESTHGRDISHWEQTGHSLGSNEGAIHHDEHGVRHYAKFMPEAQAREEVTAADVYDKIGAHTDHPFLVRKQGYGTGVAKKWIDGIKPWTHEPSTLVADHPTHIGQQLADHFHAAVLTRNWDATGIDGANLQHKDYHHLITIDTGGAFSHRAQGGLKPGGYTSDIGEIHTLRDRSMNPHGNRAFSSVKSDHLHASAKRIASIPHDEFHSIFKQHQTEHLWPAFEKRLSALKGHYGL